MSYVGGNAASPNDYETNDSFHQNDGGYAELDFLVCGFAWDESIVWVEIVLHFDWSVEYYPLLIG